jgi:hypothetical protein
MQKDCNDAVQEIWSEDIELRTHLEKVGKKDIYYYLNKKKKKIL